MMSEFPFQLLVKRAYPDERTECLSCTALLRFVPGRRAVYDALWNNRNVVAKVFSHKISARRHLRREWRGLNNLASRKLSISKPLFYGQTEDGEWAVVVEKISNSLTALDVFEKLQDPAERLDLLILVGRELAKQHIEGVLQKDLHLGNFLLKGDKVFPLDAGQMQFLPCEIGRKKSIAQLAMLVLYLPTSESARKICEQYFKARNWDFRESDEGLLQRQLSVQRKRGIRHGLKKCLRTSKRCLRIRAGGTVAVFDKSFSRGANPIDFIGQIDTLMDQGRILKDGNTCYVSRLTWNSKDVVVKRYNHKGFIHSLRHTIKRSRARRGWLHGHRLGMLDIATPKPLAYIERRRGLLIWESYLVTEYIEGQKFYNFLRDKTVAEEQRLCVTRQIKEIIDDMGKCRITHGDMKHTNILITKKGPVLTDLDAMRAHKWHWSYRIRRAKDLGRFDWEKLANDLLMRSHE